MTLAWQRECRLVVAPPLPQGYRANTQQAVVMDGLPVSFRIKKTLKKEPNHSEITVKNLSPATRARLSPGKGARAWLSAGYAGAIGEIFQGDVSYFQAKHDGPDWECRLLLHDGGRAYKFARATESFIPGTNHGDILRRLVAQSGLDPGNAADYYQTLTGQAVHGYSFDGPVQKALTDVLAANHLTYSIQHGAIQILPARGYIARPAVLLTPATGLIGSPEWGSPEAKGKAKRLKCKSLLQAQLVVGGRIKLESATATGVFVIHEVEHKGDTHGDEWMSELEVAAS